MALQQTITEPKTGAVFTDAYGKIDNSSVRLAAGPTEIHLNWYYSQATSRMEPIRRDPVTLEGSMLSEANPTFVAGLQQALAAGAIQSPMDALKASLYFLLMQMPDYAGAIQV